MEGDTEIGAMTTLAAVLEPLGEDARHRVLNWALSRFAGRVGDQMQSDAHRAPIASQLDTFESFAELYDAASPKLDKERALTAAYWIQVCGGQPNFPSQILNSNLKDLGRGIANITDALDALKEEKPALVLQLRKSGTSKQARKVYRLTQEGAKRVQQMISKELS